LLTIEQCVAESVARFVSEAESGISALTDYGAFGIPGLFLACKAHAGFPRPRLGMTGGQDATVKSENSKKLVHALRTIPELQFNRNVVIQLAMIVIHHEDGSPGDPTLSVLMQQATTRIYRRLHEIYREATEPLIKAVRELEEELGALRFQRTMLIESAMSFMERPRVHAMDCWARLDIRAAASQYKPLIREHICGRIIYTDDTIDFEVPYPWQVGLLAHLCKFATPYTLVPNAPKRLLGHACDSHLDAVKLATDLMGRIHVANTWKRLVEDCVRLYLPPSAPMSRAAQ
jgi:hypothetical protein